MGYPTIHNDNDLELAYIMKNSIEKQENIFQYESFIIDIKRKIRAYNKRENKRIEHNKIDYYINNRYNNESCFHIYIYNDLFTDTEKQEIINDLWISVNSPYDCTGKLFTQYIHISEIKSLNKTIIIHSLALDI